MSTILSDDVVLQKIKAFSSIEYDRTCLHEMQLDGWFEDAVDKLVMQLTAFVLEEKIAERHTRVHVNGVTPWYFPKSPWHFFRYRHPRISSLILTVTKRPIQYHCDQVPFERSRGIVTEQFALFPESPIRTPQKFRGPIVVRYEETTVR